LTAGETEEAGRKEETRHARPRPMLDQEDFGVTTRARE